MLNRLMLFASFGILVSCAAPPDIPGCTAFPSKDYFVMRDMFIKLCGDDPACRTHVADWKKHFAEWTVPSDSGVCLNLVSGKQTAVDPGHSFNGKTWPDLVLKSVMLPAKESVAPLKTYIQDQCHQTKKCGSVGNWETTIKELDVNLE